MKLDFAATWTFLKPFINVAYPKQVLALSFNHSTHSLWHCLKHLHLQFISIPCHIIRSCIFDVSQSTAQGLLQHIPKVLKRVKVWTLWRPIHVWKSFLILPEPLFHNLSLMNPGFVTLPSTARALRPEKKSADGTIWSFSLFRLSALGT